MNCGAQIEKLLQEIDRRVHEIDAVNQKYGIDPSAGMTINDVTSEWLKEHLEIKEKFTSYLEELDHAVLIKLHALMYFGRDHCSGSQGDATLQPTIDYFASMKRSDQQMIQAMNEKIRVVPRYIQRALNTLNFPLF